MTTVTVNEEIIALTEEVVETITVTVAEQGPPGVDADHSGLLNLESDDHLQYHTDARGDARYAALSHDHGGVYEPADADLQAHLISTSNPHSVTAAQVGADATGTAAGLIATHEAAVNPHPGYLTPTEGDVAYAALSHDHSGVYEASGAVSTHAAVTSSVHGITTFGASLVDDADAGTARNTLGLGTAATTAATDYATAAHNHTGTYDPAGTASSAVSSHEGAADPHPGYALESSLGGAALLSVGTTTGTVAAGDDARFATGTTGDAFASSHPGGNSHIDWTADQGATNLHAGNIPDLSGTYATAAQGSTADSAMQPGDDAADLGSGTATDNYVLTADGSGGAAWEAAAVTYAGAASEIHAATDKATPVDADELGVSDSAASWVLKKLTWANLKTALASVFAVLAGKSGGQTLIGGTGVTDKLVLQGTSGNGTSTATALEVKVGNNGLTSAVTITNDGKIFTLSALESGGNINIKRVAPALLLENTSGVKLGLSNYNDSFVVGQYAISDTLFFNVVTRKMGINTSSPSAAIHAVKTTEQLRLGYDATNYVSATVSSTGNLTLDTSGGTIYTPDVIENTTSGAGIVLRSSNGTRYMITVTDAGTLSVSAA